MPRASQLFVGIISRAKLKELIDNKQGTDVPASPLASPSAGAASPSTADDGGGPSQAATAAAQLFAGAMPLPLSGSGRMATTPLPLHGPGLGTSTGSLGSPSGKKKERKGSWPMIGSVRALSDRGHGGRRSERWSHCHDLLCSVDQR